MPPPPETELDDGRMPFFEHLRELRDRLRNATIAFVVGFVVCWFFSEEIYKWLRVPIDNAWLANKEKLGDQPTMHFSSATEPFWVYISVSLWAGIFVSSPLVFHQLWQFIAPGLYKRERRIGIAFAFFSALFFVGGALFCYFFVLEKIYAFLLGYADATTQPTLMMSTYLDTTRNMMLAFGAVFELPMLILFLSMAGMVTHKGLWKFNRWFVVIAFIVGAVLTPSPDVVSQIMMALPMIILYNASIIVAYIVTKRRAKREAAERAAEKDE